VRWVWVVIPLVLFSVIGIQESFADSSDEGKTETKKITTVVHKTVDGKPVIEKHEVDGLFYIPPSPTLEGCEKTSGWIPWDPDSKIMPDLQAEIDAGKENLCVEIVLPFVGRSFSSDPDDLNTVLTNLDTLSKFLKDNGAIFEQNRFDIRKYVDSRSMHIGASIPASLITELIEREDVVSIDVYGKIPQIPWYVHLGRDTKVSHDLQEEISSGKEIILTSISLQSKKLEATTIGHSVIIRTSLSESEIKIIQKSIIELLQNNNIETQYESIRPNYIIANVPSSFISELEKLDEVTHIDTFDKEITSFGNDVTSEKTSVQDESDDELILDIALDANSAQLSISGDAQNLKEIPIPDNVLGKEIDLLVNGVVENNFEIVSSSSQTLLTLPPILFQDTPIEENLPPISPLKQIKNGILPEDVICKEGLELIFKLSDGSPACVQPSTTITLVFRGWSQ